MHVSVTLVALLGLVVVVAIASFVLFAFREARALGVSQETLRVPDLPAPLDGIKLVFLADIHAGPLFGEARVTRLVDRVNELRPDVILLGGDYVGGKRRGAEVFYPAAARFAARFGVYAVLGNHDWWEGVAEARRRMAEAGITLLENASARIAVDGVTLAIAGIADEWTSVPDVTTAAADIRPDDVAVLLAHNPDSFDDALARTPGVWALALAGHTHGGQVRGAYLLNPHKPTRHGRRYLRRGLTEEMGVPIIVSHGVGAVTVPLRFFARPEIHLITMTR